MTERTDLSNLVGIPETRTIRDVLVVHTTGWQLDCKMLPVSKPFSDVHGENPGQVITVLWGDFYCILSLPFTCLATVQCSASSGDQQSVPTAVSTKGQIHFCQRTIRGAGGK